jgi:hypothetical protein
MDSETTKRFTSVCAFCGVASGDDSRCYPVMGATETEPLKARTWYWAIPKLSPQKPMAAFAARAKCGFVVILCCSEGCKTKVMELLSQGFEVAKIASHTAFPTTSSSRPGSLSDRG